MNNEDCATEALARASNQHLDDRVRQINALLAIGYELKRFNDREELPPQKHLTSNHIEINTDGDWPDAWPDAYYSPSRHQ